MNNKKGMLIAFGIVDYDKRFASLYHLDNTYSEIFPSTFHDE